MNQELQIWEIKEGDWYGIELRLYVVWTNMFYYDPWSGLYKRSLYMRPNSQYPQIQEFCNSDKPTKVYRQETLGL